MNRIQLTFAISIVLLLFSCSKTPDTYKIAFGSCAYQDHDLPIFYEVIKHSPDLFIFLGDNIYGDSKNLDTLKAKYGRLAAKPSFKALKKSVPFLATWDDHDYGWNDTGRHYVLKEQSKQLFMEFFEEPADSERRKHAGIYNAYQYKINDKLIQIIMLDTRTFRDDIRDYNGEFDSDKRYFYQLDYAPHTSSDSTFLGAEQWNWLDQQLQQPADIRIIGSSTQFGIEFNGYEAWANFPQERQRFLDLIKKNKANGVLFISGDVHYAEISKIKQDGLYPIYDVTASGLSESWKFPTPNKNRIEGPVMDNHFGLLTFLFGDQIQIKMEIWDVYGNQRIEYTVPLSELQF